MNLLKTIASITLIKHIALAVGISLLLIVGVMYWLSVYTHHGEAVVVPDVKHLAVQEAELVLQQAHLRYQVVDSIHVKNAKPGSIVELIPKAGSKVKSNRIIFLVTNFYTTELFVVPEVKDLSLRQALAMLKASGFDNVRTVLVASPYKNLVVGIQYLGEEVQAGKKLPANASLSLLVSSGQSKSAEEELEDQLREEPLQDNSWF